NPGLPSPGPVLFPPGHAVSLSSRPARVLPAVVLRGDFSVSRADTAAQLPRVSRLPGPHRLTWSSAPSPFRQREGGRWRGAEERDPSGQPSPFTPGHRAPDLEVPAGEDAGASGDDGSCGEEGDGETAPEPAAADDIQCPKEEEVIRVTGSPGCKTCRFVLVRRSLPFNRAQNVCKRCYQGSLASIHNYRSNLQIQSSLGCLNQGQVWIGGQKVGQGSCQRFRWLDGTSWNYSYWAFGQPQTCGGRCVTLCTRGGHWRQARCSRCLPSICSY
uniref:C-type lectin domain-containing protein n=1 Tax=Ornithorhynchus anatinus TaxID=9258 RepID=A0A6I8P9T4_ORNAN